MPTTTTTTQSTKPSIPSRLVRVQLAGAACVDERAVLRYYTEPHRLRPSTKAAIELAIRARVILHGASEGTFALQRSCPTR